MKQKDSVVFSQKRRNKNLMKRERRKIGIRKKLYEVILQPIQGEDRAHDKDGP